MFRFLNGISPFVFYFIPLGKAYCCQLEIFVSLLICFIHIFISDIHRSENIFTDLLCIYHNEDSSELFALGNTLI